MTVIRAHFDGRVLVPEGPIDLPRGQIFQFQVVEDPKKNGESREEGQPGFPTFKVPPDAKTFTTEDVKRAEDEPY